MDKNKGLKPGQKKEKSIKLSEDAKMRKKLNDKIKEMETEFDINEHLVIDLGNAFTKIGLSGEDLPTAIIPSLYARKIMTDKNKEIGAYDQKLDVFGYEATEKKYQNDYELFHLTCGDHKEKTSKEYLEFLKDALENRIGISPSDYDVIVNISPIKSEENIRTYGHLFIEDLGFKAMAMINSSSLSLYATGRTSGLAVQCGEKRTYTVPLYEGFPLIHATNKIKIGGRDITQIYREGIVAANLGIEPEDIFTLRDIKEKTCYVPFKNPYDYYLDMDNEDLINEETQSYKLPDERIIKMPRESRIKAAELLFNPKIINRPENGLINLIIDSAEKSEVINSKFKDILFGNIVLSGGTSMMEGFSDRIENDLKNHFKTKAEVPEIIDVVAENNRSISKWIGMSMISSMSAFEKLFIKKADYQELGEERFSEVAQIF